MYLHMVYVKRIQKLINPGRFNHRLEVKRWYKDGGDEEFRYKYNLSSSSIVFDAGGYEGEWSKKIYEKYHCNILVFEPVKKYAQDIKRKFSKNHKVTVLNSGLGGRKRKEKISIEDVSSSIFKPGNKKEEIEILDIRRVFKDHGIKRIGLLKINVEGGEYEILERLLDTGLINLVESIQVQFHNFVPDAQKRMEKIQRRLSKTHRPTYQYWFVWENWTLKNNNF